MLKLFLNPQFVVAAIVSTLAFAGHTRSATAADKTSELTGVIEPILDSRSSTIDRITGDASLLSSLRQPIHVLRPTRPVADSATRIRVLIQGGLHGNEPLASEFVLWLAQRIRAGEGPLAEFSAAEIELVPFANPDGVQAGTRANPRGVNLNRNFATLWGMTRENPGEAKFSEAETRAIRALFRARQYDIAIDVHGYINWLVGPSPAQSLVAAGRNVNQNRAALHGAWSRVLSTNMNRYLPGYELKSGALLGNGGAFEDWAFWDMGALAVCLELENRERFERVDFLTSGIMAAKSQLNGGRDSFLRYEKFVAATIRNGIRLKEGGRRNLQIDIPSADNRPNSAAQRRLRS